MDEFFAAKEGGSLPSCLKNQGDHCSLCFIPLVHDHFIPAHRKPSEWHLLLHCLNGDHNEALDTFNITLVKRGLKCLLGVAPEQKSSITIKILLDLRTLLDPIHMADAAVWSLFTLTFFSFLRKSYLTLLSSTAFDPSKHLTRDDLKFTASNALCI